MDLTKLDLLIKTGEEFLLELGHITTEEASAMMLDDVTIHGVYDDVSYIVSELRNIDLNKA